MRSRPFLTLALAIAFAIMLGAIAADAHARPRPLPDVRASSMWEAEIAPYSLATAGTLCGGARPSDLDAWTITGQRIGDALLVYLPGVPALLPPLVLSSYAVPVRAYGWCG